MARTYTVKAGDNLAKIAERFYGSQRMLTLLVAQNGGSSLIRPGDVLRIPNISQKQVRNWNISQGEWAGIQAMDQALYGYNPSAGGGSRGGYQGGGQQQTLPTTTTARTAPTVSAGSTRTTGGTSSQSTTGQPLGSAPIGGSQYYSQYVNPQPAPVPPASAPQSVGSYTPAPTVYGGQNSSQYQYAGQYTNPQYVAPNFGNYGSGSPTPRGKRPQGRPTPVQTSVNYTESTPASQRRFRTGALGSQYGSGRVNVSPVRRSTVEQIPTMARSFQDVFNPYSNRQDQTGAQIAASIDAGLTREKAPGTYQVRQVLSYQRQPDGSYRPVYGDYTNTRAQGGKSELDRVPGQKYDPYNYMPSYLRYDNRFPIGDPRRRMIGGGEGYPDLTMPGSRPPGYDYYNTPNTYGGGYTPYSPPTYDNPKYAPGGYTRQEAAPDVGPGRQNGYGGYGGGGGGSVYPMRLPGTGSAQRSGVSALVSWTL